MLELAEEEEEGDLLEAEEVPLEEKGLLEADRRKLRPLRPRRKVRRKADYSFPSLIVGS